MEARLARSIAQTIHAGQLDRFGEPVIDHVERVARAVPHEARALAYHAAWRANVGPGQLLFAGRDTAARRQELASATSASAGYTTSRRTLWH